MKDVAQAFCEELSKNFSELAQLMNDHVADYDEIYPHVFMGDVTRHILLETPQRRQLVHYLNEALKDGPKDTQNLVAVSFVENLEKEEDLERALQGVQADELREEWRRQRQ